MLTAPWSCFCLLAVLSDPESLRDAEMPELHPRRSWFVYSAFSGGFIAGGTGLPLICACPRRSFCHSDGGNGHQGEIQPPNSILESGLPSLVFYHYYSQRFYPCCGAVPVPGYEQAAKTPSFVQGGCGSSARHRHSAGASSGKAEEKPHGAAPGTLGTTSGGGQGRMATSSFPPAQIFCT